MPAELKLESLHHRHPGLTRAIAETYEEAASVCLQRHHTSPQALLSKVSGTLHECSVSWTAPNASVRAAHANEIDATEQGAYGVSLAAVEALLGLVAIRRAETQTGADYYIAPKGSTIDDLEDCLRLEVSGVGAGSSGVIDSRLKQKIEQTRKGSSNLPAMAAVVGFKERLVAIAKLEEGK